MKGRAIRLWMCLACIPALLLSSCARKAAHAGQFLVVSQLRGQPARIYFMDAQKGEPVALTEAASGAWSPVWSPEGKTIYFASDRDGQEEIYRMAADGSNPTRLTQSDMDKQLLRLSPDGKKLAFVDKLVPDGPPPLRSNLYVVNIDGAGLVMVASEMADPSSVAWSPDSQRLVFIRPVGDQNNEIDELMIVNADGSGLSSLSGEAGQARLFSFSPDGKKLVYDYMTSDHTAIQLLTVPVDGGPSTVIYDTNTGPAMMPVHPVWTRGNQILFVDATATNPPYYDISSLYRVDPDGKALFKVSADLRTIIGPSTDGKQVAIVAVLGEGEARTTEIQVLNMDGTLASQVTHMGLYFDSARSSPDGTYFTFLAYPDSMMESPAMNWVVSRDGSVQRQVKGLGDFIDIEWRP